MPTDIRTSKFYMNYDLLRGTYISNTPKLCKVKSAYMYMYIG